MGKQPGRPKKNAEITTPETPKVPEPEVAPVVVSQEAPTSPPEPTPAPVIAPPPPPPPPLVVSTGDKKIKVRATVPFSDGDLMQAFKDQGYEVEWPAGQWRTITLRLLKRCLNSGGEFETEDGRELLVDG